MVYLIEYINKVGLCNGCGICSVVCPFNAIVMRMNIDGVYTPSIDFSVCKRCGLCDEVCPSLSINRMLSADGLGYFIRCYVGYSVDIGIRWLASSGGIATSMLSFLFDKGLIRAAVVVSDNPNDSLKPLMVLARSKEELRKAMGSRYCPVKPSFKIKDLLEVDGRIAVVGLPCHIWGFRRLEEVYGKLREKIFVRIGLFCGKCPNIYATVYFLRKIVSVNEEDVARISYRGRGWPGKILVYTRYGKVLALDYGNWVNFSYYPHFIPTRCVFCYDITNQLADISLGDAWGLVQDYIGSSVIITRTEIGEQILQQLREEGRISLWEVSPKKVVEGQGLEPKIKRSLIRAYIWQKAFKQPIPYTPFSRSGCTVKDLVLGLGYCAWLYVARDPLVRSILCNLTPLLLKLMNFARGRL